MNNIKHVFFDLDHTLWDFDKNSKLTFKKIFRLRDINLDIKHFLEVYMPLNLKYWRLYREDKIDKPTLRYKRLYEAFKAINIEISTSMIYKLSDDYIKHLPTYNYLINNTKFILNYLKPQYTLHIITNGFHEIQQLKLNQSQIDSYFKTVTNSEQVGVKKPNPKIFEAALNKAKAYKNESIMIGDSYEADVLGALNFGLDVIYFDPKNEKNTENIKKISDLKEISIYL